MLNLDDKIVELREDVEKLTDNISDLITAVENLKE